MQVSDQQRIGDRYDLRQVIGIGGMARVYLAHDRMLNRDVAVKILDPALAADPLFVERFRREAQAAAALNHPNIVTIYDTGTTDDTYFIVMEYVPGSNLKEMLRERGTLPEREALMIGAQVAAALDDAHRHHLIHRDVKSHNVLIGPERQVKVTDFGIARAAGTSHLTAAQTVMGSAPYLSPEQALHQPIDHRADLYSLGIVLYESLAGRLPFAGESLVAVAMMHVHEQPQSLRSLRPDVSPQTEAVVMRALAKDPAARYQSAAEMRAALLDAAETVAAVPTEETRPLPLGGPPPTVSRIAAPPPASLAPPGRPTNIADESLIPPVYGDPSRHSRRFVVPLVIAALLCVVVVGAILTLGRNGGSSVTTATPASATRAATGATTVAVAATVTPTVAPRPATAALPTAVPPTARSVAPTTVPAAPLPSPTPLAQATSTPLPAPTATPPPAPTPTSAPPPAVAANNPAQAVQQFYQYAAQHQWDAAAALWSDNMKRQYPVDENLIGHFNPATRIDLQIGQVQVNGDRATVAVDLTEIRNAPPPARRYVGSWQLVRGPNGWVLDQPNLQPA